MRKTAWMTGAAFAALMASGGLANDSSARLDIGGLQFVHQPDIRMVEEDLHLGLKEIRIRYLFENTSTRDIETLVAFPLPPVETGEGGNYIIESRDPINFIGFEVKQGGQVIPFQTQVRAEVNGVDVTEILKRHGLPMTTIQPPGGDTALYERLRKLPAEVREELARSGAVNFWADTSKSPPAWDGNPQWEARIVFYWNQRFPAGQKVELFQRYRPVPRSTFFSANDLKDAETRKNFCLDNGFAAAVRTRMKSWGETISRRELTYILTTANNWADGIGRFSLTVEKPGAEALVSTCFKGLKPDGPGRFKAVIEKFRPEADIRLMFVSKPAEEDDNAPPAEAPK